MTKGIKQKDLKPCVHCGKGVLHTGIPIFFRVTIERFGANRHAIMRQHGLEMMMGGNPVLANIMGPDEDMATPIDSVKDVLVCHECAMEPKPLFMTYPAEEKS